MIFTRNFREEIRGAFRAGSTALIRFDPFRVVPPHDDYKFGDPARPVEAHLRYKENAPFQATRLVSWVGEPDHIPQMAVIRAPKLLGDADIPADADWVEVYFTYQDAGGRIYYDSNWGKNYRFRFYQIEIHVIDSTIVVQPSRPLNEFLATVAAAPVVDRLIARYRILNSPTPLAETAVDLVRTEKLDEHGHVIWTTQGVQVPNQAVVVYDLIYYAEGRPFRDDNQGRYFVAALPDVRKKAGY